MGVSAVEPSPRVLRYSIWLKALTPVIALVPALSATFPLLDEKAQLGLRLGMASILVTFAGVAVLLEVELFGVRHTFDELGLDYRTPWTKPRTLRWAEVAQVKWSFANWLLIQDMHGQKFRIPPLLGGAKAFAGTALERIPKPILDASPRAAVALQLMKHGVSFALLDSDSTPEQLLARLKREGRL